MKTVQRLLVRAVDLVNRRGKAPGVRLAHWSGKRPRLIHPKHVMVHAWHDWYVPDLSPNDAVLRHEQLNRWKREAAMGRPEETTGFHVVARTRP